jgi:hypothetical protein
VRRFLGMIYGLIADSQRSGIVADCVRCARASYRYTIRQIKRDEDLFIQEQLALVLMNGQSRAFWSEGERMRNSKSHTSMIVDICADAPSVAAIFARKCRQLYTSVRSDSADMHCILAASNTNLCR